MSDDLPRIVVITDVPVERTQSGAVLLYRLFAGYPPDRLLIVQHPGSLVTHGEYRLPNVEYRCLNYKIPRLIRNKFNPFWPLMMWAGIRLYDKTIERTVKEFAPKAVLTVAHNFLWFPAAAVAGRLALPLYLIVHDDWPSMLIGRRTGAFWRIMRLVYQHIFCRIYRRAAVRLCVSPGMAEQYGLLFGVPGKVLYPSRGEDSPVPKVRVGRVRGAGGPVVAFAGSTDSLEDMLHAMAKILANLNGRLDIFGRDQLQFPPTMRSVGFLPPTALAERIADTAHALFLPAPFRPEDQLNLSTFFPSKLADYTAVGVPIIIWGPRYSSAARWGLENPGAAVTFTDPDPGPVRTALLRIVNEPDYALTLARGAIEAGRRYFDVNLGRAALFGSLRQASNTAPLPSEVDSRDH